jgi:hypothetical protein
MEMARRNQRTKYLWRLQEREEVNDIMAEFSGQ